MSDENNGERDPMIPNDPNNPYNVIPTVFPNIGTVTKPVVVFFGPRDVGKTVVLIRLSIYLQNQGVRVEPVEDFRLDERYPSVINSYVNALRNAHFSPRRTPNNDCMLLDIHHAGKHICHFLEASGEDFFFHKEPKNEYPNYLNQLFNSKQRKVLVFLFSDNMFPRQQGSANATGDYAKKISSLLNQGAIDPKRDSLIILYNKVDESKFMQQGTLNRKDLQDNFFSRYPILKSFFYDKGNKYKNTTFVPFSSGIFSKIEGVDYKAWAHSKDKYPKELWMAIWDFVHLGNNKWGWSDFINKEENNNKPNNENSSPTTHEDKPVISKALGAVVMIIVVAVFFYYAFL
ncbi:MAG: hypothetical protein ACRBFS_25325 [Aureispira sp.]